MNVILIVVALFAIGFAVMGSASYKRRLLEQERAEYIRTFEYPKGLFDKLFKRRSEIEFKDVALISRALRHFFLAYLKSGRSYVAMPSQIADDLWHEFILYTRNYQEFCEKAFGQFLHHTPAVVLDAAQRSSNAGLRRVWWQCCQEENIHPTRPSRLPLLFALDAKYGIKDGFRYSTDCKALRDSGISTTYCTTDFSDASFDGGTSGFGDGEAAGGIGTGAGGGSDGGGSGDSGGGSGCGGGCGGGGGGD